MLTGLTISNGIGWSPDAEPGGGRASGTALIIGGLLVSGIEDQADDDIRVGEA
ncbi:MAG TPA: hypothetical protein VGI66_13250 [Streptosporangiaceae bacterium]